MPWKMYVQPLCSLHYRVPPVDSGVFHVLLRGFIGVSLCCFFRNVQFVEMRVHYNHSAQRDTNEPT
jgi:hypothetical protein